MEHYANEPGMNLQVLTSFYASSQGGLKLRSDEMKLLEWAKGSTV